MHSDDLPSPPRRSTSENSDGISSRNERAGSDLFAMILAILAVMVGLVPAVWNWRPMRTNEEKLMLILGALTVLVMSWRIYLARDKYRNDWKRIADLAGATAVGGCASLLAALLATNSTQASITASTYAKLTSPTGNIDVSWQKGFTAKGTVAATLGSDTIWILNSDGEGFTVDRQALIINGSWIASDKQIGEEAQPFPFSETMVAVEADSQCAAKLRKYQALSIHDYFPYPPAGCIAFGSALVDVVRK
jgi:hypothetical protein